MIVTSTNTQSDIYWNKIFKIHQETVSNTAEINNIHARDHILQKCVNNVIINITRMYSHYLYQTKYGIVRVSFRNSGAMNSYTNHNIYIRQFYVINNNFYNIYYYMREKCIFAIFNNKYCKTEHILCMYKI